jgi:hypothetical protein
MPFPSLKPFTFRKAMFAMALIGAASVFADGGPFQIVSDIDDTVKVTDVQHPLDAIFNAFFSKRYFAGMTELYQAMSASSISEGFDEAGAPLVFVSGSPRQIEAAVRKGLAAANFPRYELFLKSKLFQDVGEYKEGVFESLSKSTHSPIIFIGDDTEKDPEAATQFRGRHPDRVLVLYIHNVKNRVMPSGAVSYFTAFDIALRELAADRLRIEDVERVGRIVLAAKKYGSVFPDYAVCPHKNSELGYDQIPSSHDPVVEALKDQVADHLVKMCIDRNWTPTSQRPLMDPRQVKGAQLLLQKN